MMWAISQRAAKRGTWTSLACMAAMPLALSSNLIAGEDPPGCNSEGVAVAIVTAANGQVIPPGGGVVPGQVIEYRAFVSVFENFPPFVFCDAIGGQLSVTLPNWESIPAGGGPAVFGTQIVPVAGYGGTPAIPQFGNSSGSGSFTGANSAFYTVDPADADAGGFLNARTDLGQTGFITQVGLTQTNSTVLSDPEEIAQASVTTSIELLLPAIALEKSASISRLCLGETELVTYTMTVTNPGETSLTNVVVTDPDCDSAISGPSGDVNTNSILETTETWVYTCTRSVTATTSDPIVNTASVTSVAFNLGRAVLGETYEDSDDATITVNPSPDCSITLSECPFPRTLTANPTGGTAPYTFAWSTGANTPSIQVNGPGLVTLTVTDANGCVGECEVDVPECEGGGEGCTPGYWKQPHHFDDWTAPFDPTDLFSAHFDDAFPGKTLLTVLSQPGSSSPGPNSLNALGRHTVAAVLNAASGGVDYPYTVAEVIAAFNAVYPGTDEDYLDLKNDFASANEAGCPLNGNSDVTADGLVNTDDLLQVINNWGATNTGDINHDGVVNVGDLLIVLTWWGS